MQQRQGKRSWRIVRRIGLGLLLLLLVLAGAGASWNALAIRHYRSTSPPPGKLYEVDSHSMHLYCTGHGAPTIVLESGLGEDFSIWAKVQPALSRTTRVCSYDRAGFGWSEPQPEPRDSNHIAEQLHALLQQAGITAPVVLMGHSAAGWHIRAYATRYPHDIAGLVFVDASTPGQYRRLPPAARALDQHSASEFFLLKSLMALGIVRLTGQCTDVPPGFDAYADWLKADACIPAQIDAYRRESSATEQSAAETLGTGPYGDLPVLIFSRDPQQPRPANFPPAISADLFRQTNLVWDALQEELKQLSTHSRRIIAKGSSHYIHLDRPDLLNREVSTFILQIRTHTLSSENGSTKIE